MTIHANLHHMAREPRYYHHGRSPAAWVGSILAAFGFIITAAGSVMGPSWIIVTVGAALLLIAGLATMIMKAMGLGQP